jgi:hypothetical protein
MPATPNDPYAPPETAIENLIFDLVDFCPVEGMEVPEAEERRIKKSLENKFWRTMWEIRKLQIQGRYLKRLQRPSANSPVKRGVGRGVSKRPYMVK